MKILEIQDLSISFLSDGRTEAAVKDISFSLQKGETLGVVGESGSGKTVTCMSILRLLGSAARYVSGSIKYYKDGESIPLDMLGLEMESLRRIRGKEISIIFQEPMSALNPVLTCGYQVFEVLKAHEIVPKENYSDYTSNWLKRVGLEDPERVMRSYPHQLSGGQLQRVLIAMALCTNPLVVIADEPTTALDVSLQKKIMDLLEQLKSELGLTLILISHDLSMIKNVCDRIMVMNRGSIVELAENDYIFNKSEQAYTKGLINSKPPLQTKLKRLPTVADFLQGISIRTFYDDTSVISPLEQERKILEKSESPKILEVQDLNVRYTTKRTFFGRPERYHHAVKNVSFELRQGEVLGLVGESGSGKSTLGKSIVKLLPVDEGRIFYYNQEITGLDDSDWKSLRKEIQIIFQDPFSALNPRKSVAETITEPMEVHRLYNNFKGRLEKTEDLLLRVGLDATFLNRYPHQLSGGQRQRICIARALALSPKLLILDESVSALDVSVQAQVLNLLMDLKDKLGLSYLFISHDFPVVHFMADRIMVMKDGAIVESGPSYKIINEPTADYTKNLIDSIPS